MLDRKQPKRVSEISIVLAIFVDWDPVVHC